MKRCKLFRIFVFFVLVGCSGAALRPSVGQEALQLDPAYASQAVQLSLHCVDAESPHTYDRRGSPRQEARRRHPAFFGCYDWHSSVHGHWAMLRVVDLLPNVPERAAIVSTLGRHLTLEHLTAEVEVFRKDKFFERPYGWGWYLRLVEELAHSSLPEAARWRVAARPLEEEIVRLFLQFLDDIDLPFREGMHGNLAYAMAHAWDYAKTTQRADFQAALEKRALALYQDDRNCPLAYEPSASDFISPCFMEADFMRRVLGPEKFPAWFDTFFPSLDPRFLRVAVPKRPKDYQLGHLVGLMFQKASAMRGVALALREGDPRRKALLLASKEQASAGWRMMFDSGYGGTHWLASFAIYYYSGVGALP